MYLRPPALLKLEKRMFAAVKTFLHTPTSSVAENGGQFSVQWLWVAIAERNNVSQGRAAAGSGGSGVVKGFSSHNAHTDGFAKCKRTTLEIVHQQLDS